VKAVPNQGDIRDIFGVTLPPNTFTVNKQITQQKFVEVHGNGAGAYATGGIK
jgi:hypothetical protein